MGYGGLYTSMAGLELAGQKLDTVSQNLANVNTQGYLAAQTAAVALPYTGHSALPGADVITVAQPPDTRDAAFEQTGDPFNVAVHDGWLAVQTASGQVALTRNGALMQASDGLLTTINGNPVLNANGVPISLPRFKSMTIATNGEISVVPAGAAGDTPKVIGTLMLAATPAGGDLVPLGNSLYGLPAGQTTPQPASQASAQQGYLEGSNVDPVRSMMDIIAASRSYSLQTRLVSAGSNTQTSLDQVLDT